MIDLASELHHRRLERGLSVAETARRARITRAYLYRLEDGSIPSNPSIDVLDRLASALGAPSINDLAGKALPDSLREFARDANLDSAALAPLAALAPYAHSGARPAEWALVHEILAHTILAEEVERRREVGREMIADPARAGGQDL